VRTAFGISLALAILLANPFEGTSQVEVSGWGGFPLSESLTSLWLMGPPSTGRPQPLIMVYYRGIPGWHKRKWDLDGHFGKPPTWIRLKSPDLELSIEFDGGVSEVKVQRRAVDLSTSTVFLVDLVEKEEMAVLVQSLGQVVFAVPSGVNPAIHVLQTNPGIAARVLK
jgi:hypothetical protein